MLHSNSARLVAELENLALLDDRYTDLKLINMPAGIKRGHFSLVFKAFDTVQQISVALKFFDLDPQRQNPYRLLCFDREHDLLTKLVGAHRCLQVISPLSIYLLQAGTEAAPYTVQAKYFATAWYEDDIDPYFLNQSEKSASDKLRLFNDVVLAVEALHSRGIFHRDIKVDNFKSEGIVPARDVVAIDLGTAATQDSTSMLSDYEFPVGLRFYSAPESFCGLSGSRAIAKFTDTYALGCMLFELFNEDDFWSAYIGQNSEFEQRLCALMQKFPVSRTEREIMEIWDREAPRLLSGLSPLSFERDSASVPLAIVSLVNDLIHDMTAPNFRNRQITFVEVRRRLWSAIRCVENDAVARKRAERAAATRQARRDKAKLKGSRPMSFTQKRVGA